MPRVSTKTTDDTIKPAPRKRAVRRVVPKADDAPAPRKRAPRKVAKVVEEVTETEAVRRAPTRFAAEASTRTKKRKVTASLVLGMVVITSVAAFIGSTDAGQINVNEKIEAESKRQPQATEEVVGGDGSTMTIPVQNTPPPPAAISGLRGRGVGTAPVEQEAVPIEVATTTESVATSTETESVDEPTAEVDGVEGETTTE